MPSGLGSGSINELIQIEHNGHEVCEPHQNKKLFFFSFMIIKYINTCINTH